MSRHSLVLRYLLGVCAVCALTGATACGRTPDSKTAPTKVSSALGHDALEPGSAPTPWRFHPRSKAPTMARLPWAEGAILEVDGAGSRWLRRSGSPAEVSAYGAPEALIGFVKDGARWGVVGRGGTVYFFSEALGPWEEVRAPSAALLRTVVLKDAIYGVTPAGRGVVSRNAGRSYEGLEHEGVLVDVAVSDEYGVVFVAAPERWLAVPPGSRQAQALELPSIAPLRVERSPGGELLATSLFGPRLLTALGWAPLNSGTQREKPDAAGPQAAEDAYALPEHARISELSAGHAVMSGGRYFSVEGLEDAELIVKRGALDAPLSTLKVPAPRGCGVWRLVGPAERPILLCTEKREPHTSSLTVSEWAPEEERFVKVSVTLRGNLSELRGDVSADSRELTLSGLCPPHAQETGCRSEGLVRLSLSQANPERDAIQARHLPLQDKARLLAFASAPNGTLHVLSERSPDDHLVLESFRPGEVLPRSRDLTRVYSALRVDGESQVRLGVGPEGALTVITQNLVGMALLTLDAEQRVLVTRSAPSGVDLMSGHGRRIAGVDVEERLFWTSTDYGASFVKEQLPQPLCGTDECRAELLCDAWGCLVGPELVRLGYEPAAPMRPVEAPLSDSSVGERRALPSLECTADPNAWQTLEGLTRIPQASDAWLGETLWTSATYDAATASVEAVFARAGARTVESHALLRPVPDPEQYALTLSPQVEGTVVLRARLSAGQQKAGGAMEVGWDNRIEDLVDRATLDPTLGEVPTVSTSGRSRLAQPALLSIGGRGLHVQLESRGRTVFLSSGSSPQKVSAQTVFEASWPPIDPELDPRLDGLLSGAREERIVVEGEPGALLLLSESRMVVRARRQKDGSLEHTPILLGSLVRSEQDPRSGVRLAYRGKQIGFITFSSDPDAARLEAEFVSLSADGGFAAPVRVPVLSELAGRPAPCDAANRSATARVVAPELGSSAREVWVSGLGGDALRLETDSAVLFGTVESPCLAALEAVAPEGDRTTFRSLVTPAQDTPSWLFSEERTLTGGRTVRAQPMTCAWKRELDGGDEVR